MRVREVRICDVEGHVWNKEKCKWRCVRCPKKRRARRDKHGNQIKETYVQLCLTCHHPLTDHKNVFHSLVPMQYCESCPDHVCEAMSVEPAIPVKIEFCDNCWVAVHQCTCGRNKEKINHPNHYKTNPGPEVIELVEWMNFNKGNAVKYICRAGHKNSETEVEDLRKALWYITREIQRIRKQRETKES